MSLDLKTWKPFSKRAIVIASFQPKGRNQIPLIVGDSVQIIEQCGSWYRGINGNFSGIFPSHFVKLKGSSNKKEVADSLRDWMKLLKRFYQERKKNEFTDLTNRILAILEMIDKQSDKKRSDDERKRSTSRILKKIEKAQKEMGLDITLRFPSGNAATFSNTGPFSLYKMYSDVDANSKKNEEVNRHIETNSQSSEDSLPRSRSSTSSAPNQRRMTREGLSPITTATMRLSADNSTKKRSTFLSRSSSGKNPTLKSGSFKSSSMSSLETGLDTPSTLKHFSATFKISGVTVGEDTEFHFSLYSLERKSFIYEDFTICVGANGVPTTAPIGDSQDFVTIFKDIEKKDIASELYLVVRVFRVGALVLNKDTSKRVKALAHQCSRRPLGVGTFPITLELWQIKHPYEHSFSIYTSTEATFATLQEAISLGVKGNFKTEKFAQVSAALTFVSGEYNRIAQQKKIAGYLVTSKIGFPDVIEPEDQYIPHLANSAFSSYSKPGKYPNTEIIPRHSLFFTLISGEFSQESIEVSIEVRLENGDIVENAISFGTPERFSSVDFFVAYKIDKPVWLETFRIDLTPSIANKAHLFLTMKHCLPTEGKEKSPIGFSFMKLSTEEKTIIFDGEQELSCFKIPTKNFDKKNWYLTDTSELIPRRGEFICIKTCLASVIHPQSSLISKIMNWGTNSVASTSEVLRKIENTQTGEYQGDLEKLLHVFMASIFDIIDSPLSNLAFTPLCHFIGVLIDDKTADYYSILKRYVTNRFNSIIHIYLLSNLETAFTADPLANPNRIKLCLKILPSMLLFITKSASNAKKEDKFDLEKHKAAIQGLLSGLCFTVSQNFPKTAMIQPVACKVFPQVLNSLREYFTPFEQSEICRNFINSCVYDEKEHAQVIDKFKLLESIVESNNINHVPMTTLIQDIYNFIMERLKRDIGNSEAVKCTTLIGLLVDGIHQKLEGLSINNLIHFCPFLLSCIESSIIDRDAKIPAYTIFVSILSLMKGSDFSRYAPFLGNGNPLTTIVKVVHILSDLLENPIYSEQWFEMTMFLNSATVKILEVTVDELRELTSGFLSDSEATGDSQPVFQLWKDSFQLCFLFLASKGTNLEEVSASKRELVLSRYGDLRLQMFILFKHIWTIFENHKKFILLETIDPVMRAMLVRTPHVKQLALEIYTDIVKKAKDDTELFTNLKEKTTRGMENIAAEGLLNQEFLEFFVKGLESKFNKEPSLQETGARLLKEVHNQTVLLFELSKIPDGSNYDDARIIILIKLMEHHKQINDKEIFAKYCHRLIQLHLDRKNYAEAAVTVLMHANTLDWSEDLLPAINVAAQNFSQQTQRERKALLYRTAIQFFDKARTWEKSIPLIRELERHYESYLGDYGYLSKLLKQEAQIYKMILMTERWYPAYYRVGFYGNGFGPNVRNKDFVFRGAESERLGDFIQRMQDQYPGSELLKTTEVTEDILNSDGRYLLIVSVNPTSKEEMEKQTSEILMKLPSRMRKYVKNNDISVFVYSKPFRKNKSKSGNEFEDLWLQNYYFQTKESLPSNKSFSEIISRTEVIFSPIENAVNSVISKNFELIDIIDNFEESPDQNINPFSMTLNGIIDAAVNGGVKKYQELFLSPEYTVQYPEYAPQVEALKSALSEQIDLLTRGLDLHGKICPPEMKKMQEKLEGFFVNMKADISQFRTNTKSIDSPQIKKLEMKISGKN